MYNFGLAKKKDETIMSCPYANMFGAPNTGVHSYRIADIAIVDVVLTILGAYALSFYTKSFWWTLMACFGAGIVLHRLFCVRTTVDRWLF